MAEQIKIVATTRNTTGSAEARRLRRSGGLPAVMSTETGESLKLKMNRHDFQVMLHHHSSEHFIVDVEVDGNPVGKALLKDMQHDPLTGDVVHVDLVQVSMTRKIEVTIPLVLIGDPVGVTQSGGVLDQAIRDLDVECLPGDMVEQFEADVSALKIGDTLLVRDLDVDPKYTVLTAGELSVASVVAPRVEAEAVAEEAAEAAAGAEPEVIAKRGKEEAEGE